MEKFHITIKSIETDEILVDKDTCAIIGAIDNANGTGLMVFTSCNDIDLAATVAGALKAALYCADKLPTDLAESVMKLVGLKRRTNFLKKILGSKTNGNNN